MKQITKNTVLKQGDKSYPAIQTEQGIVWIDKDAEPKSNNQFIDINDGKIYKNQAKGDNSTMRKSIFPECLKVIAANFDLEGVPKIAAITFKHSGKILFLIVELSPLA